MRTVPSGPILFVVPEAISIEEDLYALYKKYGPGHARRVDRLGNHPEHELWEYVRNKDSVTTPVEETGLAVAQDSTDVALRFTAAASWDMSNQKDANGDPYVPWTTFTKNGFAIMGGVIGPESKGFIIQPTNFIEFRGVVIITNETKD